ncbi:hypothetical protein AAFN60_19190 [Roseibacillus persicicus]|uniref:hypothetical protein n=1 Tax=Roseibacillus persicicus TaxID=454148 RepID=UPI00398ACBCA
MKFVSLLLFLACAHFVCARPALVFTSLTELGWQVHIKDLESGEIRAISKNAGDKRTPKYCAVSNRIITRGPRGTIVAYDEQGNETELVNIPNCGDISVFPGKEDVLFTRLTTGNPQRQQIWKATPPFPKENSERITAVPKGSLRQVQPDASGTSFLASHLWRFGEERIVLLKEREDKGLIFEFVPLTPEMRTAAYPGWLQDEQWVCSYRVSKRNYDLYRGSVGEEKFQPLLETKEFSEFGSTFDAQSNRLYFERLSREGFWSLACLDLETLEVIALNLPAESKEPFFTDLPDTWFP